jgi:hypothetical protein
VFIDLEEDEKELMVEEQEEEETMTSHVKALTLATLTPKPHFNILHNMQTNWVS